MLATAGALAAAVMCEAMRGVATGELAAELKGDDDDDDNDDDEEENREVIEELGLEEPELSSEKSVGTVRSVARVECVAPDCEAQARWGLSVSDCGVSSKTGERGG